MKILRLYDQGNEVLKMQNRIRSLGLPILRDGKFGVMTKYYVEGLQASLGIIVDGIFGEKTNNGLLLYEKNLLHETAHFHWTEFKCKCCVRLRYPPPLELLLKLEFIRNYYKKKIIILSGWRCARHNTKCGGSPKSQHLSGLAADFRWLDKDDNMKRADWVWIKENINKNGGNGFYDKQNFFHLDVRQKFAQWEY